MYRAGKVEKVLGMGRERDVERESSSSKDTNALELLVTLFPRLGSKLSPPLTHNHQHQPEQEGKLIFPVHSSVRIPLQIL
jgi:hypothetical protein